MKLECFGEVIKNANLKNMNTYGIETYSDYLVYPLSKNNLCELIKYLKENNIKYFILGGGSNVVLPDNHFQGVIISLKKLNNFTIKDNLVEAECGVTLSLLINNLVNNSLGGLESLHNIPGTLGGAIYGNAGVKDTSIMDYIEGVEVIRNNDLIKLKKNEIKYSYRYTEFKDNDDILVSATLRLENRDIEKMKEMIKENRLKRNKTQPLKFKNAGSVFKNPEGYFAGALIEKCDLKGYNVGDAMVSEIHANFIVNIGNAKSEDIKKLINIIKSKVEKETGIVLELEQIIVEW